MFDLIKGKGQDFCLLAWNRLLDKSHRGVGGDKGNVRDWIWNTFNLRCLIHIQTEIYSSVNKTEVHEVIIVCPVFQAKRRRADK